ncbi:hypothetical protein Trydic_g8171 [Trypoxylus dichotomus]
MSHKNKRYGIDRHHSCAASPKHLVNLISAFQLLESSALERYGAAAAASFACTLLYRSKIPLHNELANSAGLLLDYYRASTAMFA